MSTDPLQEAMDDVARHLIACAQCQSPHGGSFPAMCQERRRLIRTATALIPGPVFRKAGGR